jgi:hypothetical protein
MARRHGPKLRNLIVYKAQAADHVMRSGAADSHQGQERYRSNSRSDRFMHLMPPKPDKAPCAGGVHRL